MSQRKRYRAVGAAGQSVWDLALELAAQTSPGDLLDAAAGGGYLAELFVKRGFNVTGMDLLDQWQFPDIPFVAADLDAPLQFADASFDVVTLVEALGYVGNPAQLLQEFHRVLRPGGALLITVPNVFSLQSRLRFLLNGTYRWFPHPIYHRSAKEELADVYRDPIRITTLCFLLEQQGFQIERVQFGGQRPLAFLLPIGWGLQFLTAAHNLLRGRKGKQTPALVNSGPALWSTNVGVLARKRFAP